MTNKVRVGDVYIGGGSPVSVQSMTNTDTRDVKETLNQIHALYEAGCDIVRLAVPDMEAAECFGAIKKKSPLPLVADVHFDYRIALECIKNGADKIRINPGNIGDSERIRRVAEAAKAAGIPIRIGVNSGSLEKDLLSKYGAPTAQAMVESAKRHIGILNDFGFDDIVVSLKASSVPLTIESYRLMAKETSYPLHLGVTEAGTVFSGTIKSAVGIGSLLAEGIGDTIRVSLTADPCLEVRTGIEILKALGLRKGCELISCPTCGRTKVNLFEIAEKVEKKLEGVKKPIKVAVMGCAVNGPGEAKHADVGIAGGDGDFVLFKKGKIVAKLSEDEVLARLFEEVDELISG